MHVSCGKSWDDCEVLAVDPDTGRPVADGVTGELWLTGSNIAQGYWNQPEETALNFQAQIEQGGAFYLRTGDLGFMDQGEVYVTGRLKDLIFCAAATFIRTILNWLPRKRIARYDLIAGRLSPVKRRTAKLWYWCRKSSVRNCAGSTLTKYSPRYARHTGMISRFRPTSWCWSSRAACPRPPAARFAAAPARRRWRPENCRL